jgi:hypothetical protein
MARPSHSPISVVARDTISALTELCTDVTVKDVRPGMFDISAHCGTGLLKFEEAHNGYELTISRPGGDKARDYSGVLLASRRVPLWTLFGPVIEIGMIWRLCFGKARYASLNERHGHVAKGTCFIFEPDTAILDSIAPATWQAIDDFFTLFGKHTTANVQIYRGTCRLYVWTFSEPEMLKSMPSVFEAFIRLAARG